MNRRETIRNSKQNPLVSTVKLDVDCQGTNSLTTIRLHDDPNQIMKELEISSSEAE